jgi:hypothetical protein
MKMDPTGPTARRFPLLARPRPACTPLEQRVTELVGRAHAADRDDNTAAASAVHNLAALLASDCRLPDLARQWCRRHAEVYLRARPLDARATRGALEPLVNLARLRIRDGEGQRAFDMLEALFAAVADRADTAIDGVAVPAATLFASPEDHREVRRWLWARLLATGARALADAGRWNDAHARLSRYNGVGRRILDGRQVAVIARATSGDPDGALALLGDTVPGEPWENAVTACLTALCRRDAGRPADRDVATLLDRCRRLAPGPGLAVFHTRLGLSAIDAAGDVGHPAARRIAADVIHRVTATRDGYAARDLLAHDVVASLLTPSQAGDLKEVVEACALGSRTIPLPLRADITAALGASETVLTRTLVHHPNGHLL